MSISDHKDQLLFSVTMNNLREADSGWYMCGVEIGGMWSADVVTHTHIKVIHGESPAYFQLINGRRTNIFTHRK